MENALYHSLAESLIEHRVKISALERERDKLNAGQLRIEEKVDNLKSWIMSTLAAAIGALLAAGGSIAVHLMK